MQNVTFMSAAIFMLVSIANYVLNTTRLYSTNSKNEKIKPILYVYIGSSGGSFPKKTLFLISNNLREIKINFFNTTKSKLPYSEMKF